MKVVLWAFLGLAARVVAQEFSGVNPAPSGGNSGEVLPTPSNSLPVTIISTSTTVISTSINRGQTSTITTIVPINITSTLPPTLTSSSSVSASSSASASATPTPDPFALDTHVDPGFGVLGALLILTGLPSAFWGHKNRWSSFFIMGFYTMALICLALILKFGVLQAVNPPSKTLRGLFVLACTVAGIVGGAVSIFFWKHAKYFIGGWGGFVFALWLQCFRDGGVIRPVGFRWIFYIGLATIGFILTTPPKLHYPMVLASTAAVGATAFMLGVDCFSTAGLKEFYVWNLGFTGLFPKYANHPFPVTQTMQIELGLIGAVTLMGAAVQLQLLKVLKKKLLEIKRDEEKREAELEAHAAERFKGVQEDIDAWEKEHGRQASGSIVPLMKDIEAGSPNPETEGRASSQFSLGGIGGRIRRQSAVSDYFGGSSTAAGGLDEAIPLKTQRPQSPGPLPALHLGNDIQEEMPTAFVAKDNQVALEATFEDPEDLRRRDELMSEIANIRKSIDVLKSETSSEAARSRHQSLNSRRTLSQDLQSQLRPLADDNGNRSRVQSMELSRLTAGNARSSLVGEPIMRPGSAPLRDDDWESYVRDRKLLHPPSGPTPPPIVSPQPQRALPAAVSEALLRRQRLENAVGKGKSPEAYVGADTSSSEDVPLRPAPLQRSRSSGATASFLPPARRSGEAMRASPSHETRPHTEEQLRERHRDKMRAMQDPLTTAEKQVVDLQEAKDKWERTKKAEREQMARKQAERMLQHEQEKRRTGVEDSRRSSRSPQGQGHRRSNSLDRLGMVGSSSKRLSTMKVESWQRYQENSVARDREGAVPFPKPGQRGGQQ